VIDRPPTLEHLRRHARTLVPYGIAAVLYIALGAWEPRLLLSWVEGILFVFVIVWAVPALVRRLRR